MRLPCKLNEGTCKSQPLPESIVTPPKDSRGNDQPLNRDLIFMTSDEGMAKTTLHPKGSRGDKDSRGTNHLMIWNHYTPLMLISHGLMQNTKRTRPNVQAILLSKDEAQESDEEVLAAGDDMDDDPRDDKEVRTPSLKQDQPTPSHVQESASNSSSLDLKRFDNILPLTKSVTPTLSLTDIQANVEGENATATATKEPPSHTERETKEPILVIPISSTVIPSTQPIISIIIHPKSSQATLKIDKGKRIATESDDDPSKKLVKASSIVRPNPDEPVKVEFIINGRTVYLTEQEILDDWDKEEQIKKAEEEARLNAISKTEVIKVVCEEAKKLGIHLKEAIFTKAGELFKLKMLNMSRLKPEPITDIKIHPKTKPVVITIYRGTDGRNFDVHKPFLFGAFGKSKLDELREIILKKKNTMVKYLMNSLSRRMYGIFFTGIFGDQPFQKWSDIDKVGIEALVSYLVAASMVKSPENARFSTKLRKLIVEHPDQEKLKSKKVKLEAFGYNMD
nr:hypothetical protein [Tanacetum cinerariifolium]